MYFCMLLGIPSCWNSFFVVMALRHNWFGDEYSHLLGCSRFFYYKFPTNWVVGIPST
jgi:hypothetical protein